MIDMENSIASSEGFSFQLYLCTEESTHIEVGGVTSLIVVFDSGRQLIICFQFNSIQTGVDAFKRGLSDRVGYNTQHELLMVEK